MERLSHFSEEQRKALVALPYRTGFWVSVSDESGGAEADESERVALENIVSGFAEDFCKTEVVEQIMQETLAQKTHWAEWEDNIDNVPTECREAIELLADHFDYKEVSSFKNNLMEIAMAVAMAYREFDETSSLSVKIDMYKALYLERFKAWIERRPSKTADEILNVSYEEQLALTELTSVLRLDEQEGLKPESDFDSSFQDEQIESERLTTDTETIEKIVTQAEAEKKTKEKPVKKKTAKKRNAKKKRAV